MKKLFYLLALLSVSIFMISCSVGENEGNDKVPATGIDLASLDSLVGDYVVDNYSIAITTKNTATPENILGETTITKDNYTLTQGYLSHATITNDGESLSVSALISNDSILGKIAALGLSTEELNSYHNINNIFVALEDTPKLVGEKLGNATTGKYEITKSDDKTIKLNYTHEEPTGTSTRTESGYIILTKTSNTPTNTPTVKKSLYHTVPINEGLLGPVGRYAISKYEYVKTSATAETTIITADPLKTKEKNLIGGLAVGFEIGADITVGMNISMQTDLDGGFKIEVTDDDSDTTVNYIFKNINVIVPEELIDINDPNMVKTILEALGAEIIDANTMTFTLIKDQPHVEHGFPLEAGDSIILTLNNMNDGGIKVTQSTITKFENKPFFTAP